MKTQILDRLNKLTNWQATAIIAIFGVGTYWTGLANAFQGDDQGQIVNNPVVRSISHIRIFFEGGTFYSGQGIHRLIGAYYRPLMTTVYSLIDTIFGPRPFAFHLVQLMICIGSTAILFLLLRYTFKPALALFLSLVFLIHPIDSQIVFAIPSMQDALFFFFGVLALYLLTRYKSLKALLPAVACLVLSLLAKETAILFVAMAALYLFLTDRKRLYQFIGVITPLIIAYLFVRAHAVGWSPNPNNAPIDRLNLTGRLLTDPSIIFLYITKLVFPLKLASWYYWTYPTFTFIHTALPLFIDLLTIGLFVYLGLLVRRKAQQTQFVAYIYFAAWTALGILPTLQFTPIDMTACETWFYFSMVGLLGMLGIAIPVLARTVKINASLFVIPLAVLILVLSIRTAVRGTDWSSDYNLAQHNLASSSQDFQSENDIAIHDYKAGDYYGAKEYSERSFTAFPYATNANTFGASLIQLADYQKAHKVLQDGLKYIPTYCPIYDNLSALTAEYGNANDNYNQLIKAIETCPQDAPPWLYLAVLEYTHNNIPPAKIAINQAYMYGQNSSLVLYVYNQIMSGQPLDLSP